MGRLLGDGGWYFHVIDMAVLPEHQCRGLGDAILSALLDRAREWLRPLENDLENLRDGGRRRLTELQHLLLELVRQLDDKQKRYPFELRKA